MYTVTLKSPALPNLDRDRAQPLYQQIKSHIEDLISSGAWQYGARIPSENQLVADLGVSRMTINRALRELTQERILKRIHGVGTYVAEPARHASLIQLQDIADEVRASGCRHSMRVRVLKRVQASRRMMSLMEVGPGAMLFELCAVHYRDATPIQYEHRFVNPVVAPNFLDADFSSITATRYLIDHVKPDEMEHRVQAVMPDKHLARILEMPADEPCLRLGRRTWKAGQVVTHVELDYPSSRYDLSQRYATGDYLFR